MPKTPGKDIFKNLHYNPETGEFLWLSGQKKGKIAGCKNACGYCQISYKGSLYYAHRLAFFFMKGNIPKLIDHANGDRYDNSWGNIRECTPQENMQNLPSCERKENKCRIGAYPLTGKFISQIRAYGKNYYLGRFLTEDEAHNAYLDAKKRLHSFQPVLRNAKQIS